MDVLGDEKTAPGVPVLKGYLFKESRYGRMQRRYYVTNNAYLNYYKRRAGFSRRKVLASVDLRQTTTICVLVRNGKPSRRIAIQVQTGANLEECVFLRAKTRKIARAWVDGLNMRRKFWVASELESDGADGSTVNKELVALMDDWEDRDDGMWAEEPRASDEEDTDEGFVSCDYDESPRPRSSRGAGSDSDTYTEESDDSEEDVALRRMSRTNSMLMRVQAVLPSTSKFSTVPTPWFSQYWSQPSTSQLRVRGPHYLTDHEKIAPPYPLMELVALDVRSTDGRLDHIAAHPGNRVRLAQERGEKLPFIWICNFQVPGPPFFHFACYFVASKELNAMLESTSKKTVFRDRNGTEFPPGFRNVRFFFACSYDAMVKPKINGLTLFHSSVHLAFARVFQRRERHISRRAF